MTTIRPARRALLAGSAALALASGAVLRGGAAQGAPAPVRHPNPRRTLRVIGFAGGFNLPVWAAQRQGFFAEKGLEVRLSFTPNSMYQITNQLADNCDIAMTAIGNVVADQEGQNEAPIGPNPDLFAFFGSDDAFLSLAAQARIRSVADLRGQTLTVDAMTTGFAELLNALPAAQPLPDAEAPAGRCDAGGRAAPGGQRPGMDVQPLPPAALAGR